MKKRNNTKQKIQIMKNINRDIYTSAFVNLKTANKNITEEEKSDILIAATTKAFCETISFFIYNNVDKKNIKIAIKKTLSLVKKRIEEEVKKMEKTK